MEHKGIAWFLNILFILLIWAGGAAFYYFCLMSADSGYAILILMAIGLGFLSGAILIYVWVCSLENFNALTVILIIAMLAMFVLGVYFSVAQVGKKFELLYALDKWKISAISVIPTATAFLYNNVNRSFKSDGENGVAIGFFPYIYFVMTVIWTVAGYFAAGWIVTLRDFEVNVIVYIYYLAPIVLNLAFAVVWAVIKILCRTIVKIGVS